MRAEGRKTAADSVHPVGWDGGLVKEAVRAFDGGGQGVERAEFTGAYLELVKAYEEKLDAVFDAADAACVELIVGARVPYLVDTITAPVDDETEEDARQKLVVKQRFVDAMERLQEDLLPTKRRGNLPKESTAYLKRWFDEHYDHPCRFGLLFTACSEHWGYLVC